MKKTVYALSWSKVENESYLEQYHSFFSWIKRIVHLLKDNHSVLIYRPEKRR